MTTETDEDIFNWAISIGIALEPTDSIEAIRSLRKISLEAAELARQNNEAIKQLSPESRANIISMLDDI